MSWPSRRDRTELRYNKRVVLHGFPEEAFEYQPNGKAALEWVVERYVSKQDKKSGILNDANDQSRAEGNPRYIIDLVKRVTTVSVETMQLVKSLPEFRPLSTPRVGDDDSVEEKGA